MYFNKNIPELDVTNLNNSLKFYRTCGFKIEYERKEDKFVFLSLGEIQFMLQELILDNTNEGDLVFDPCAGGMTTAIAAAATNRKFICCELDTDFYNKGIEFLKKEGIEINGTI